MPPKSHISAATPEPATSTSDEKSTPKENDDPANAGIRREPELPEHEDIEPSKSALASEFTFEDAGQEPDDEPVRLAEIRRQMGGFARQASLDPADDLGL
jgi:type IV secretion system protein VirD4